MVHFENNIMKTLEIPGANRFEKSYADVCEEQKGAFQREYLALKEYMSLGL